MLRAGPQKEAVKSTFCYEKIPAEISKYLFKENVGLNCSQNTEKGGVCMGHYRDKEIFHSYKNTICLQP